MPVSASEVSGVAEAGAPEDEIEVTPAMLEAGAEVVSEYSPHETTADEIALEAYRAMEKVRRRLLSSK
jgi:hypothetical protein